MKKYSQYNEEEFLIDFFKQKKGFVVEIGAADGTNNSNSRFLIENGWDALLVEPNLKNYYNICDLYKNKNNIIVENCGCSDLTEKQKIFFVDHNDRYEQLSTFSEEQMNFCKNHFSCDFSKQTVDVYRTQEIFNKHSIKNIDFLSVDTESFDLKVLKGIDFSLTNINLICVENIDTIEYLKKYNYKICFQTIGNLFLIKC